MIEKCRLCGHDKLREVLDFGEQCLTGIFKENNEQLERERLTVLQCDNSDCDMLQLSENYDLHKMYGENYGYRSGLNRIITDNLYKKYEYVKKLVKLETDDVVLDIGSSDGVFLNYFDDKLKLIGFDPAAEKWKSFYRKDVNLVVDFFGSEKFLEISNGSLSKVVSTIGMFYDLVDPIKTAKEINSILDDEGIWILEQSYLPTMMKQVSYDMICHEHLVYYSLKQLNYIFEKSDFKIIDYEFTEMNGGSLFLTVAKKTSKWELITDISNVVIDEDKNNSNSEQIDNFRDNVFSHRKNLMNFVEISKKQGKTIYGLGASTKGNVILQFCELNESDIIAIGDVNPEKYGKVTPGSNIPIIDEDTALSANADYYIVFPWHFKEHFMQDDRYIGKTLVFPLPKFEIIQR